MRIIRRLLFQVLAASACLSAGMAAGSAGEPAEIGRGAPFPPRKALLVLTQRGWGCLTGQTLREEAIGRLGRGDMARLRLEEIKNPEDREDRNELYLTFPAHRIDGLAGSYVVRLSVEHSEASHPGVALIDSAEWTVAGERHAVELTVTRLEGQLKAELLYGREPELKTAYLTCPEVSFEPFLATVIGAYTVGPLDVEVLTGDRGTVRMRIPPALLDQAREVDACEVLLHRLDAALSLPGGIPSLWDGAKVDPAAFRTLTAQVEQENGLAYRVRVELWRPSGTEVPIGMADSSMVPDLRRQVALSDPKGGRIGGEVRMGVQRSGGR